MSTRAGARVLVTGASGLIGRNILELIGAGADTHAVSRHPQPARAGVTWWQADLAQPGVTTHLMHEIAPEIVIHLAGEVRGERSLEAVAPTLRANLVASVELLEAAARLGCRRVVVERVSARGARRHRAGNASVPVWSVEMGVVRLRAHVPRALRHADRHPATVVRVRPGAGDDEARPTRDHDALAGGSPALSSGDRLLDLVFARDVAEAYLAAAVASDVEGSTIDIGVGHLTSVRDVVATIVELVGTTAGAPEFGRVAVRPLEQQIEVDPETAAAALGWRAQTPLVEGLRRTITWYRESLSQAAPDVTTR